jgi:hypothetical protein
VGTVTGREVASAAAAVPADRAVASTALEAASPTVKDATKDYKASLGRLISIYEEQRGAAAARAVQVEALFADQIVSQRELDDAKSAVTAIDRKIVDARAQLAGAEAAFAPAPAPLVAAPPQSGPGIGQWSLAHASLVRGFYQERFGRSLPVSAYGQSHTHDRLGWDHHDSMDVALHPDSREGRALVEYLSQQGIPHMAFRAARPGVATGAHIHIGRPSNRL